MSTPIVVIDKKCCHELILLTKVKLSKNLFSDHRYQTGYIPQEAAEDMFFRLVDQIAEKAGVTEQLKADNQMLWVARMNNIRNQANEIVNDEIVYNT